MSLQDSLAFIRHLKTDHADDPEKRLHLLSSSLEDLVELAAQQGYRLSVEELRKAHLIDWKMRSHRFSTPQNED